MKIVSIILFGFMTILWASCSKSNSSDCGSDCLLPMAQGNVWVYQDSVFNFPGVLANSYVDSVTVGQSTTDINGLHYSSVHDPLGWFGPTAYLAVDQVNYVIWGLDSLSGSSYLFFSSAPWDWTVLGTSQDFTNPSCIGLYTQYGFYSTANINGYDCQVNIGYTVDCNFVTTEEIVYYVCPGVGVVRIEDYAVDRHNHLYLDYSQTLRSAALK